MAFGYEKTMGLEALAPAQPGSIGSESDLVDAVSLRGQGPDLGEEETLLAGLDPYAFANPYGSEPGTHGSTSPQEDSFGLDAPPEFGDMGPDGMGGPEMGDPLGGPGEEDEARMLLEQFAMRNSDSAGYQDKMAGK